MSNKEGNTVWAICRDEYLRYDMTTGLLEIYETERDAQTNKQPEDQVVPVRIAKQESQVNTLQT